MICDSFDLLAQMTVDLADARTRAETYRDLFKTAVHQLHERHLEGERQRRQIASLIDENRRLRAWTTSRAAA